MFNMTLKEIYDLLKIDGCQLDIRFDYPFQGQLTLVWLNGEGKQFGRLFSKFEVETMKLPKSMVIYCKNQAEESFSK